MNDSSATSIRLLVSVRDEKEAKAALAGGADWIDLKEPAAGPLGAVGLADALLVAKWIAGRAPLSAACGELIDWPCNSGRQLLEVDGLAIVKLGLAGCRDQRDWRRRWAQAEQEAARADKQLVMAAYADYQAANAPPLTEVADWALQCGATFFLLDTWNKSGPALLDCMNGAVLAELLQTLRSSGVKTVLAGSLTIENIGRAPLQYVDILAVRSAACVGGRSGRVSAKLVRQLRDRLQNCQPPIAASYRPAAG